MGIAARTGFGNPSPERLPNKGELTGTMKAMIEEAMELYDVLKYGVDYKIRVDSFEFGREPSYQFDPLMIIGICKKKEDSYIETGKAFGAYGSGIRSRIKIYKEYKGRSKFVDFIDKWHGFLYL